MTLKLHVVLGPIDDPLAASIVGKNPSILTPLGYDMLIDTTTILSDTFPTVAEAGQEAITQYAHLTAAEVPVNGVYVVDDTTTPHKIVAEMTKAGYTAF